MGLSWLFLFGFQLTQEFRDLEFYLFIYFLSNKRLGYKSHLH